MTEHYSHKEYVRLLAGHAPPNTIRGVSSPRRDMRWHNELHSQLAMHPALKQFQLETEFLFHPTRKYRADFAFPFVEHPLLIEVEGLVNEWDRDKGEKSAHQTWSGVQRDCEKHSNAAVCGYRVIRVTKQHIESGQAIGWILDALGVEK